MKYRLMDLLACPLDKDWPLKLEIMAKEKEPENISIPNVNSKTEVVCNFYCGYKDFFLVEIQDDGTEIEKSVETISKNVVVADCKECFQIEIQKGRLLCSKDNNHIYEIKESIPVMLTSEQIQEIYGKKK
ncbi:MAG: Trm112 family protein [Candidatus Heimdallarchaeota archaeon]|nr:Trm112 family protein [Candidatus Heimdallarchaeota archaeon]